VPPTLPVSIEQLGDLLPPAPGTQETSASELLSILRSTTSASAVTSPPSFTPGTAATTDHFEASRSREWTSQTLSVCASEYPHATSQESASSLGLADDGSQDIAPGFAPHVGSGGEESEGDEKVPIRQPSVLYNSYQNMSSAKAPASEAPELQRATTLGEPTTVDAGASVGVSTATSTLGKAKLKGKGRKAKTKRKWASLLDPDSGEDSSLDEDPTSFGGDRQTKGRSGAEPALSRGGDIGTADRATGSSFDFDGAII